MKPLDIKARFDAFTKIGCIVCRLFYGTFTQPCIHHLTGQKYRALGKKADDKHTIPLCPMHHQYGNQEHPSIHGQPALFTSMFGNQTELLNITNNLISKLSMSILSDAHKEKKQ